MIRRSIPGLALLATIAATTACMADGLTARISSDKMAMGDTFQLTLSADPTKLTAPPDVSALNADFDILGTSKSSQTRIINGNRSDTVEWIVSLAPRAKGHFTIPVLKAGQATSEPISLDVVDASDLPGDQQAQGSTKITATLASGSYYVQQEIPLTLRISTGPGFRGGTISTPDSPDYILAQRGDDRVSEMTANGQPVTVIERDYLLRPQKSGTIDIAPFTLNATEEDPAAKSPFPQNPFDKFFNQSPFGSAGSPFGQMFNPGREVAVRIAPLTLEVRANPSAAAGWFLPAKAVSLTAEWDPKLPVFRVGEAVTRHVRIQALGATETQLPDLALPQIDGARIYLDKSRAGSVNTPDGTSAVRDFTYSVVPLTGGQVTLPAMTVDWFDTAAETARTATLPAETISVEGPVASATTPQKAPEAVANTAAVASNSGNSGNYGWNVALLVAVTAILACAVFFWWHRTHRGGPSKRPVHPIKTSAFAPRRSALKQVETACAANDAKASYAAALRWLGAISQDAGVEEQLILHRFPELKVSWSDLETRVFSSRTVSEWDAGSFLRHIEAAERATNGFAKGRSPKALPPLYPGFADTGESHAA